jgi:hypothetical protein
VAISLLSPPRPKTHPRTTLICTHMHTMHACSDRLFPRPNITALSANPYPNTNTSEWSSSWRSFFSPRERVFRSRRSSAAPSP